MDGSSDGVSGDYYFENGTIRRLSSVVNSLFARLVSTIGWVVYYVRFGESQVSLVHVFVGLGRFINDLL